MASQSNQKKNRSSPRETQPTPAATVSAGFGVNRNRAAVPKDPVSLEKRHEKIWKNTSVNNI